MLASQDILTYTGACIHTYIKRSDIARSNCCIVENACTTLHTRIHTQNAVKLLDPAAASAALLKMPAPQKWPTFLAMPSSDRCVCLCVCMCVYVLSMFLAMLYHQTGVCMYMCVVCVCVHMHICTNTTTHKHTYIPVYSSH
jgi:hypothetical protein